MCECPKIPSSTITTHTDAVIVNPKRLSYLQAGYKQLIDERPEAPRGKAAALTRYDETAGRFSLYCDFAALSVQNDHETVDCRAEL